MLATAGLGLLMTAAASAQLPPDVSASSSALEIAPAAPASPAAGPAPAAPPTALTSSDPIHAQVGTRVTFRVQNPAESSRDELNDVASDGEVDVMLWGQIHPFLRWQAGFVGNYGPATDSAHADVLDLIAKLELAESFNVWIGRMPMPSDRTSLSTVWALPTWTTPGTYSYYPLSSPVTYWPWPGPRYGTYGRGNGVTLWGQMGGGRLKYYAGVFDLDRSSGPPLYTGRVNLSLINPEPGYGARSGYYGNKNLLALGFSGQHQGAGSTPGVPFLVLGNSFDEAGADLLFEMNEGGAGVVNVEGAFAKIWGDSELASYQAMGLASYLVPIDIGIGRIQPLLRWQHAGAGKVQGASNFTAVDAQLGYIIDGYHARLLAVYQYAKLQNRTENAIVFGLQLLSHAR
jgi:hypothetical protein